MPNTGGVYTWSRTGLANASADSTVNFAEGQAPSTLNDSSRNAMASVAKWRDDNTGAIVTGGSASNYTFSSYQVFDNSADMNGQTIAFIPHVTNTGAQAFINVDGLGLKTLRLGTGIDVPAGTLVAGTPYRAVYNNSDGVFYLHNFFNVPYLIPIGGLLDYVGPTAPSSSFVFPFGQAISRSVYATLFASVGTTFGAGDGSTTFNLPDLRGRVVASPDNMGGGTDPNRLNAGALAAVRNSVGGAGGESGHTLAASEIPTITATTDSTFSQSVTSTVSNVLLSNQTTTIVAVGGSNPVAVFGSNVSQSLSGITSTGTIPRINSTSNNTGGGSHNIMQPTILLNRIMRII